MIRNSEYFVVVVAVGVGANRGDDYTNLGAGVAQPGVDGGRSLKL